MITLDPTIKGIAGLSKTSKFSKKEELKKIKFMTSHTTKEANGGEQSKEIIHIAPMLFLQEVNDYDTEQGNLEEFGKNAIRCLRALQFALINGELKERHLHNIRDALKNRETKFNIPELRQVAEELTIRMEIELAKIERNKRSPA